MISEDAVLCICAKKRMRKMKLFKVDYLGYATADRRLSNPMIPWILAEIRKGSSLQKVNYLYTLENV